MLQCKAEGTKEGEHKISFLEISYQQEPIERERELRIISLEQICGQHIRIDNINDDIRQKILSLADTNPEKYRIKSKNKFVVIGPNSNDITMTANGKSPWFLVKAMKSSRQQINMLFLGAKGSYRLWGLEISSGLRMKKSTEKYGKEKIANYLKEQVRSVFTEPEKWIEVDLFFHE